MKWGTFLIWSLKVSWFILLMLGVAFSVGCLPGGLLVNEEPAGALVRVLLACAAAICAFGCGVASDVLYTAKQSLEDPELKEILRAFTDAPKQPNICNSGSGKIQGTPTPPDRPNPFKNRQV